MPAACGLERLPQGRHAPGRAQGLQPQTSPSPRNCRGKRLKGSSWSQLPGRGSLQLVALCLHVVQAQVFVLLKRTLVALHFQLRVLLRGVHILRGEMEASFAPLFSNSWAPAQALTLQQHPSKGKGTGFPPPRARLAHHPTEGTARARPDETSTFPALGSPGEQTLLPSSFPPRHQQLPLPGQSLQQPTRSQSPEGNPAHQHASGK